MLALTYLTEMEGRPALSACTARLARPASCQAAASCRAAAAAASYRGPVRIAATAASCPFAAAACPSVAAASLAAPSSPAPRSVPAPTAPALRRRRWCRTRRKTAQPGAVICEGPLAEKRCAESTCSCLSHIMICDLDQQLQAGNHDSRKLTFWPVVSAPQLPQKDLDAPMSPPPSIFASVRPEFGAVVVSHRSLTRYRPRWYVQ